MALYDETPALTGTSPSLRGDVRSARSRMRTKYGSQRQILELADTLGDNETLRFLAVAGGPSQPDRHNHGLIGLTDLRLIFVPRSSANERVFTDLTSVNAFLWSRSDSAGVLTVMGQGHSASYTGLSSADGRELMALAVRMCPHIKRVGDL